MANCKSGDIARVVGPAGQLVPALVTVLEECPESRLLGLTNRPGGPIWHCETLSHARLPTDEGTIEVAPPGKFAHIQDCYLRPLHGGDEVDEVIKAKGKPRPTLADQLTLVRALHRGLITMRDALVKAKPN